MGIVLSLILTITVKGYTAKEKPDPKPTIEERLDVLEKKAGIKNDD